MEGGFSTNISQIHNKSCKKKRNHTRIPLSRLRCHRPCCFRLDVQTVGEFQHSSQPGISDTFDVGVKKKREVEKVKARL